MKRTIYFFVLMLLMASCSKQMIREDLADDKWNGYRKFLKAGEQIHTLWAGKNINIGTVTYGLDENANFYATYDCSVSGWLISETHLFAGDKADMPLNKPGAPKIGLFPHSGNHNPGLSTVTYTVPLSELPPCADPGFVVAAHCVVHSPTGQTETAWAEGNYTFSDKGWGWYDDFYYTPPAIPPVILYGTTYTSDSLRLYLINVNISEAELILVEYVGNNPGHYNGAAYALESGMFLFTNYNTKELWVNDLNAEDPSFCAGTLSEKAAGGTWHDGSYYYVSDSLQTIHLVLISEQWIVEMDTVLDTICGDIYVGDVAMNPSGDYLYIIGQYNGNTELLAWEVATQIFYTLSIPLNNEAQIAFGSDGTLYTISPIVDGGSYSAIYSINTSNGVLTEINEGNIIIIDDPFTDISGGPAM